MAVDAVLWLILGAIVLLLYCGCKATRRKTPANQHGAAGAFDRNLDRAA